MQDCFRQYPDVYGAELEDDDEPQGDAPAPSEQTPAATEIDAASHPDEKQTRAKDINAQVKAETAPQGETRRGRLARPQGCVRYRG